MSNLVDRYTGHFLGIYARKLKASVAEIRIKLETSPEFVQFCGTHGEEYLRLQQLLMDVIRTTVVGEDRQSTDTMALGASELNNYVAKINAYMESVQVSKKDQYARLEKLINEDVVKYSNKENFSISSWNDSTITGPKFITKIMKEMITMLCDQYPRIPYNNPMRDYRTALIEDMIKYYIKELNPTIFYESYRNLVFQLEGDKLDFSKYYPDPAVWKMHMNKTKTKQSLLSISMNSTERKK